jgi:uncharacterized SAM-binding protein YcdF (DUF218 family)
VRLACCWPVEAPDVDLALIDAAAPGMDDADLIFVFGTLHVTAAEVAGALYEAGHAPLVVVTGGESRARPDHHEALRHRELLLERGIPDHAIVVESRSQTTAENVSMALPLIRREVGDPRSVIAVVKWFHRRALLLLARSLTTLTRVYAADYEPFDPLTGKHLRRDTWVTSSPQSCRQETETMRQLITTGWDPLRRDGNGWIPTAAPSRGEWA